MTSLKTYKLGDLLDITSSKRIFYSEYVEKGIPFFRSKEIIERFKGNSISTKLFISHERFNEIKNRFGVPQKDDLLLTSVGTIGIPFLVKADEQFYFKDGNLTWIKNYSDKIIPKYLFFWITSSVGKQQIEIRKIGSTQQALTIDAIKKIEIDLPSKQTQQRIASILSSLDDKIELNRQTNQTLETIAQTIFQEKCVQKGEELPERWRVGKLGEILDSKGGTTPSTTSGEFWNGEYNWVTPKDLSNKTYPVLLSTERTITEKGLKQISSGLLPKGTLLMSSRAPIGYFAISQIPVAINQGFIAINGKSVSNLFLLYYLRSNIETIKGMANGSTFLEISKSVFRGIEIVIPPKDILNKFETQVKPIFQQIVYNEQENQTLIALRDSLLPKLMKGEIEI